MPTKIGLTYLASMINRFCLLPRESDIKASKSMHAFLVTQVLKMLFFNTFGRLECHIAHEYSAKMTTKSEVVGACMALS